MAFQAKIALTCQDGNVVPAERIILLESDSPVAPVGRASKSISKGLFSAADNAWFDSPVMSRDHAKITMNAEDKTINIQDIGSMHGTYVNGVELARNVPSTLNNGDIVVFGAEVRRGPETFPACSFCINYEISEIKATNTYACPESSDIEDAEGEDYDFSDDEDTRKKHQSSEDDVSMEPQSPTIQKINNAIDLTRDDSPEPAVSNRIDLTGETPSENIIMNLLASRPSDINHHADPVSIGILAGNVPILVESEDEQFEAGFSDSAEQSEDDGSSESEDSETSNICLDEEVYNTSGDSEAESEIMAMDRLDDIHGFSDPDEDESPVRDSFINRYARAHDNATILVSDIRTRTQFPESVADDEGDDNESEFGLSEAGEAGLRALIDGGLLHEEANAASEHDSESESESEIESEYEPESPPEVVSIATVKESDPAESAPMSAPESLPPLQFARESKYSTLQAFTGDKLGVSYPSIRQPSPSDAAMVKSAAPPQQGRLPVSVAEVGGFGKSTAQILGDKTGKTAFFEAREVNKAKFTPETKSLRTGFSSPIKITRHSGFGRSLAPVSVSSESPSISTSGFTHSNPSSNFTNITRVAGSTFPSREPCSFLDKPDQTSIPARTPSPPLDMTSAYNFHLSKGSMTATSPAQTNSRGIKINDIIDTAATPQLKLKRKADDISDATDVELRMWAKASSAPSITKITVDSSAKKTLPVDNLVVAVSAPANHIASEARPAKRMKKLLENVGYAALGGVAVGAGLFTVLVATAPDFL